MKPEIEISSSLDGNMFNRLDMKDPQVVANRQKFLDAHNIDIAQTTFLYTTYDSDNFKRYIEIDNSDKGQGMLGYTRLVSDALIVRAKNHALFLAIADCLGVVLYDPGKEILMLSHVGRHHLAQKGAFYSVEFLKNSYGCDPNEILVTMSPSAGSENYPLFGFQNRSIREVAVEQMLQAGISSENIKENNVDTTNDYSYYSHSEFLKGNRGEDNRFAIVAMMRN
jgi:copper oxidase (laccase) domain-containing protein